MILCDGFVDLRLGRWQDALADVTTCDAVICDPPYSSRTHEGHAGGIANPASTARWAAENGVANKRSRRRDITYAMWTATDVEEFCAAWATRCRGWTVTFNSHDLIPTIASGFEQFDRYVFAPLPFFSPGSRIRLSGDGPSSWTTWINVTRPKTRAMQRWGTLPGGYVFPPEDMLMIGGKPLGLMRAIVRDYTRPGDLVVDPFCGGGTTALACAIEGRRCITSEMDPVTFEKARRRLSAGFTPSMFQPGKQVRAKQGSMV